MSVAARRSSTRWSMTGAEPGDLPGPGRRQPGEARRPGRRLEAGRPGLHLAGVLPLAALGHDAGRTSRSPTTFENLGPDTLALKKAVDGYIADALKLERPYNPGLRAQGPAGGHDHHLRLGHRPGHLQGQRAPPGEPRRPGPRRPARPGARPGEQGDRRPRRSASSASPASTSCCSTSTSTRPSAPPRAMSTTLSARTPPPLFTADIVVPALWASLPQARPAGADPQPGDVRGRGRQRHHHGDLRGRPGPRASPTALAYTGVVAFWLWLTVVFANLAEAVAEGRGKAQADALRATRSQLDGPPPGGRRHARSACRRPTWPGRPGRVRGRAT